MEYYDLDRANLRGMGRKITGSEQGGEGHQPYTLRACRSWNGTVVELLEEANGMQSE
jgi:hypothetical protein